MHSRFGSGGAHAPAVRRLPLGAIRIPVPATTRLTASPHARWLSLARGAGLFGAAIGVAVLAGWVLNVDELKSLAPGLIAMKANTALGFVLAGAALWSKSHEVGRSAVVRRRIGSAFGGAGALIGLLTLAEYATGRGLGIDELLFREPAGAIGTLAPGRMAPASAVCLLLVGVALMLDVRRERQGRLAELLAVAAAVPALASGLAYLYGASNLYGLGRDTQMAVHTVVVFLVLSAGLLCLQPERGPVGLLRRDDPGGMIARRLFPAALVLPVAVGLLKVTGDRAGLWEPRFGVVLVALTHVVLYSTLATWAAWSLSRATAVRNRAEAALRESEGRFQALFEQSPAIKLLVDSVTGEIVDANVAAADFYGYPAEQLRTMSITQIDTLPAAEVHAGLARALADGSARLRSRDRLASGDVRDVDVFTAPVEIGGRRLREEIVHDVTEQTRAEQALSESHSLNEALLETIPFGIDIVDAHGRLLFMNGAMKETVGRTALGEQCWDVYKDDRRQCADCPLIEPIRVGETRIIESTGVLGGRIFEIGHTGMVYRGEPALLEIFHDVTDRKLLEERVHLSQKMEAVGQLAGGVAHDFNNLLTVINGAAELALGRAGDDAKLHHELEQIMSAGGRAEELIQQLLAFGRRQMLQPRVVDLNAVVGDTEKLLRRLLGEDIRMISSLATDLGRVRADPGQIGQVLMNLAVNARDAMPGGGSLTLETSNVELDESTARTLIEVEPGPYVVLTVGDTGRGMDDATKARAFEPFFTTKPFGEGAGLGLATVYGIVQQLGGAISVHSEPEEGTTFKLYFPMIGDAVTETPSRPPPASRTGSEHILLVEDEEIVRDLIVEMLEQQSYRVTAAGDPATALELSGNDYDLLLTDVIMPTMNGRELVDRLAVDHPDLKTIYMSGYTSTAILGQGLLESEIDFLQKPFSLAQLADKVRDVLDR